MPLVETLPLGPGTAQWPVWSTTARIVVTEPAVLPAATDLVRAELDAVERACSRFRDDSELAGVQRAGGRSVLVSPLLADLVAVALRAAEVTGGDVDPTIGATLRGLGYDRDYPLLSQYGGARPPSVDSVAAVSTRMSAADWRQIRLRGRELTIPPGVELDLGATAKGFAADRCATRVHEVHGVGVLVSLGGDIATAGSAPPEGWQVRVQDGPDQPWCLVGLPAGMALATSSTASRQWHHDGHALHHIIDPRTGRPATRVWRTASVAAACCVQANAFSTAALVRGGGAPSWLAQRGWPARLVSTDGQVVTVADWPSEGSDPSGPSESSESSDIGGRS